MQSSAQVGGHPLHAMLIPFPFAYLVGSAAIDAWARASDKPEFFRTATHLNTLGLASALVAAVPGLVDYTFTVPPRSSARTRATNHMFANLAAVGLFALARLGHRRAKPPRGWAMAAELCGAGLLTAGGWMGGTLVTRNQIGVDHRYAEAGKWKVEPRALVAGENDIDVGRADDLQVDQMKLVRIGPRRIVVARVEEGYVAFDDRCPHKGGPLSDGALVCGTVQCPWHGSQFDVRSGEVKHGPARQSIETYPVRERGGRLWLNIDRRFDASSVGERVKTEV